MHIIDTGVDLNKLAAHDVSLLMAAAEGGCAAIVALSLDKGLDVNAVASDGSTALSRAHQPDIIKLLLDAKADVHIGQAMQKSCEKLHHASVKMLLDAGAPVNGEWRRSYLHYALTAQVPADQPLDTMVTVINLLIDAGANTQCINWYQKSALHQIPNHPDFARVAMLLIDRSPGLLECRNERSLAPLMDAAQRSRTDVVKFLIDAGADTESAAASGLSLLDIALFPNCFSSSLPDLLPRLRDTVRVLLAAGCDVDVCDAEDRTAAMLLVRLYAESGPGRGRNPIPDSRTWRKHHVLYVFCCL
jgi:ankyrin repeat protein